MAEDEFNLPVIDPPPGPIIEKLEEINGWENTRRNAYTILEEQLDMLWHDIDDDKFGADAKTGTWYLAIKKIKDDNAKPADPAALQAELDALITEHHG